MMTKNMIKEFLEDFVQDQLEEITFEELLEEFDLQPGEVFTHLYFNGLISEETINNLRKSY